jgi:hypothetical protein
LSLWKATKRLKQPTQHIPPIQKEDHTWSRSDKEKANTFAGHLEKTFKPNELPQNEAVETEINKALEELLQIIQQIKFFYPRKSKNIIEDDLNPKKAIGYDLITGRILKQMPRKRIVHLKSICDSIIITGYFPAQWKVVQIVMILKPGILLQEVSSCRTTGLLPVRGKIFEKAMLKKLHQILEEN